MCVVALALHQHPNWPILLVGNRDEFHARASAPLHAWDDGSGIIAGRDLVGGGTWLGTNPALGRIAVITNVPGSVGNDPAKASRGGLVTGALTGEQSGPADGDAYNGFALLRLDGTAAQLVSNMPAWTERTLPPAVHAIANRPIGGPCPRAAALADALRASDPADDQALFALLRRGYQQDFVPGAAAQQLFLRNAVYGTRCSTIIRIDAAGRGMMWERRFDQAGALSGDTRLDFAYRCSGMSKG